MGKAIKQEIYNKYVPLRRVKWPNEKLTTLDVQTTPWTNQ